MTVTLYIGDVFERIREIPDHSIDFVACSPPFLALRSYLPDWHPQKDREIGSEATPADWLDTLLELTAEFRRILTPHGSIAIELGDCYSGSGGAGGDYDDEGWRGGQPRFGGSASRARTSNWSYPDALWLAGVIDTEGSIIVHVQERGDNSPSYRTDVCIAMMDRQVVDRAAEVAGVGNVNQDGRGAYSWHVSAQQARYVLTNIWPYLLIKQRQAQAAIELQRHIEEHRGRGRYNPVTRSELEYREMIRGYVSGLNARGEQRGQYVPTWEPPTPPRVSHPLVGGTGWPLDQSLAMIPTLYPACLAYGRNLLTGTPSPAGKWRVRNLKAWVRSNPPVGALGRKERPATSYITVACTRTDRWFDLDAVRTAPAPNNRRTAKGVDQVDRVGKSADRGGNWASLPEQAESGGAPPLDWYNPIDACINHTLAQRAGKPANQNPDGSGGLHHGRSGGDARGIRNGETSGGSVGANGTHIRRALQAAGYLPPDPDTYDISPKGYTGAHYAVWPPELCRQLIDEMCPRRVCTTCGEPSRRIVEAHTEIWDGRGAGKRLRGVKEANWKSHGQERDAPGVKVAAMGQDARRVATTLGWSDCGHNTWRPGTVLDPFAGSGTTLAVTHNMGRHATGIDIDQNAYGMLATRLGPLIATLELTVHWPDPNPNALMLPRGGGDYQPWAHMTGDTGRNQALDALDGDDDEPDTTRDQLAAIHERRQAQRSVIHHPGQGTLL